jgi:hypothetical protein
VTASDRAAPPAACAGAAARHAGRSAGLPAVAPSRRWPRRHLISGNVTAMSYACSARIFASSCR